MAPADTTCCSGSSASSWSERENPSSSTSSFSRVASFSSTNWESSTSSRERFLPPTFSTTSSPSRCTSTSISPDVSCAMVGSVSSTPVFVLARERAGLVASLFVGFAVDLVAVLVFLAVVVLVLVAVFTVLVPAAFSPPSDFATFVAWGAFRGGRGLLLHGCSGGLPRATTGALRSLFGARTRGHSGFSSHLGTGHPVAVKGCRNPSFHERSEHSNTIPSGDFPTSTRPPVPIVIPRSDAPLR